MGYAAPLPALAETKSRLATMMRITQKHPDEPHFTGTTFPVTVSHTHWGASPKGKLLLSSEEIAMSYMKRFLHDVADELGVDPNSDEAYEEAQRRLDDPHVEFERVGPVVRQPDDDYTDPDGKLDFGGPHGEGW